MNYKFNQFIWYIGCVAIMLAAFYMIVVRSYTAESDIVSETENKHTPGTVINVPEVEYNMELNPGQWTRLTDGLYVITVQPGHVAEVKVSETDKLEVTVIDE